MTLNDRAQKPEAQWTWTKKCKDERKRSGFDDVVVEYGNSREMEVHVLCSEDVSLPNIYGQKANRRDLKEIGEVGSCTNGE